MTDALDSEDYQPEQMPHLSECLYFPGVCLCVGGGGGCALLYLTNKSAVTYMEELVRAIFFKDGVCAVFRISVNFMFFNLLQFAKATYFPGWGWLSCSL